MKNKPQKQKRGGETANRNSSLIQNKLDLGNEFTLTYIIYQDHVEFRNSNSITMRPYIRETIGWKSFENNKGICICSDLPVESLENSKTKESGFLILKSDIIVRIDIHFDNCFICNRRFILGNINP